MYNSLYLARTYTDINQAWPNSRIYIDNHFMHLKQNMKQAPFCDRKKAFPLSFTKLDILKAFDMDRMRKVVWLGHSRSICCQYNKKGNICVQSE